jgi:hypothetical protein
MLEQLVKFVKGHEKFKARLANPYSEAGSQHRAESIFGGSCGDGLGQSLSLLCVYFQHSMFVDAAESSNVCQPSWYLIAFGCRDVAVCEKLVDVLAGRVFHTRTRLFLLSCRVLPSVTLLSQSCHTFLFSRAYNIGSLIGNLKSVSEA